MIKAAVFTAAVAASGISLADVKVIEDIDFKKIYIEGNVEVEITQGVDPSVSVRGSKSKLDPLPLRLRGDTLNLGRNDEGQQLKHLRYKVVASDLEAIELAGSGAVYVKPLKVDGLNLSLRGSGDLKVYDVDAEELVLTLAGSGNMQLAEMRVAGDTKIAQIGRAHV